MGKTGKHSHEAGRGRQLRRMDRAQLEFEDMLIEEYLLEHEGEAESGADIPVRYGGDVLAAHLSDSGIAAALLDAETFQASLDVEPMAVSDFYEGDLFAFVEDERREQMKKRATAPCPADDAAAAASCAPAFGVWGMVQGFLIGAAACLAVLAAWEWLT